MVCARLMHKTNKAKTVIIETIIIINYNVRDKFKKATHQRLSMLIVGSVARRGASPHRPF